MGNLKASLIVRVKVGDKYPYLRPVLTSNGKLRQGYAMLEGKPTYFADAVYYLRYSEDKRLRLINVGKDSDVALIELRKRLNKLELKSLGTVVDEKPETARVRLATAIAEYCAEITVRKSKRTADSYERVLRMFERGCSKTFLDEMTRQDLIDFFVQLKRQGLSERTQYNYGGYVDTFLGGSRCPSC